MVGTDHAAWSERSDPQVQKMEQTIEQDLATAMVGLREQFRQHPKFSSGTSTSEAGMVSSIEAAFGVPLLPQHEAATLKDFRSEAAAARDEMLDGLSRLRRELEVQRLEQTPLSSVRADITGNAQYQAQIVALESSVSELQHGLAALQNEVRELLREQRHAQPQPESAGQCRSDFDGVVDRLDRLEILYRKSAEERTAVTHCLGAVSEMDNKVQALSAALASEQTVHQTQLATSNGDGPVLAKMQGEFAALSGVVHSLAEKFHAERPSPDLERTREEGEQHHEGAVAPQMDRESLLELQRRVDDVHQASSQNYHEIAEGLMLEIASRQAQVTELRSHIAEELPSLVDTAMRALRVDIAARCRGLSEELGGRMEAAETVLRTLGAGINSGRNRRGCHSGANSSCGDEMPQRPTGGAKQAARDALAARAEAIEAGVQRKVAAMASEPLARDCPPASEPVEDEAAPGAAETSEKGNRRTQSLISPDLKESLEQLVDKVNRTLKPDHSTQGQGTADMGLGFSTPAGPRNGNGASTELQSTPAYCSTTVLASTPGGRGDDTCGASIVSTNGGSFASPSLAHAGTWGSHLRGVSPRQLRQLDLAALSTGGGSVAFPISHDASCNSLAVKPAPGAALYAAATAAEKVMAAFPIPSSGGAPPPPVMVSSGVVPVYVGPSTAPVLSQSATAPVVRVCHMQPTPSVPPVPSAPSANVSNSAMWMMSTPEPPPPGRPVSSAKHGPASMDLTSCDSKETFRRCLQSLRDENRALREGIGRVIGSEGSMQPAWHGQRAVHGPPCGSSPPPTCTVPPPRSGSVQLSPGTSYRTLSPAQRRGKACSPPPNGRRSYSPLCTGGGLQRATSPSRLGVGGQAAGGA